MDEPNENGQDANAVLKLDGSHGAGDNVLLTIITTDPVEGEKEETFLLPYLALRTEGIERFLQLRLIAGYKIVRKIKPITEG